MTPILRGLGQGTVCPHGRSLGPRQQGGGGLRGGLRSKKGGHK